MTIPSIEAEERLPLSEDEITLVTETYTGHRMGLPSMIMLYAGLRRGEMLALTWHDIDLKAKTITVNKSLFFDGNKGQKKSPKTKMGNRVVPIPNVLMDALAFSRKAVESILICPAIKSGDLMTNTAFRDAWKSYMHYLNLQAGGRDASRSKPKVEALKPFGAHQLRHSYATMLYDARVDAKSAQKFMGHADLSTTLKIYTHLSDMKE